mgnify:CR=1 FL=1
MQQVLKLLVLLVDPSMWNKNVCLGALPGSSTEQARHMSFLLSYKECFLDPNVARAIVSLLGDAIENHGAFWGFALLEWSR